jgi:hypothetical protein
VLELERGPEETGQGAQFPARIYTTLILQQSIWRGDGA